MNPANIYKGPAQTVEISTDGGSTWTDLGVTGNNNVELNFEPTNYELGDGSDFMVAGVGSIKIELAETDSTTISNVAAGRDSESQIRVTALDGSTYTTAAMLLNYGVKRGFGDEPHILTVNGKKKFANESDFITIA